jgi:hypothetical protein
MILNLKLKHLCLCVFAVAFFVFTLNVSAQTELPKGAIQIRPDEIVWVDAPSSLPPGAKISVLEGNPMQEGIFTMRVKFPPFYRLDTHTHPKDERVTVLAGAVYVGFGSVLDTAIAQKFTEDSFYLNPVNEAHYVFTGEEGVVFQVTGLGPWGLNYIEEKK